MMRDFIEFIMEKRLHSALIAGLIGAVSLQFIPAAVLSGAIVALVWLRRGALDGSLVALGSAAIVVLVWQFVPSRLGFAFPMVLGLFVCVFAGAEVLRRSASQGLLAVTAGLLSLTYVALSHLLIADLAGYWRGWLKLAIHAVPGATVGGFEKDGSIEYLNAFATVLIGAATFGSVALGRWMQAVIYNPRGFQTEFCQLRISVLALIVLVLLKFGAGALHQPILETDLLSVAVMMFSIQGLAVMHGVIQIRKLPWLFALPPYVLLTWAPQHAIEGIAALGAIDVLMDFRRRAAKPQNPAP